MNAVTTHKTNTFKWLLKREYWENRGGFLWAPAITGAIFLVMTILGISIVSAIFWNERHGSDISINPQNAAEYAQGMGYAGDTALLLGVVLAFTVLAFVVFFYSLGSLYDDRRDRSVLFWKSMPVSDRQTVLSKVTWALVLAPLISIGVGLVIGLLLWLISIISATVNDVPAASAIVTESHPLRVLANILVIIPVYAFWALPTVGWLMFCSAWAKRFPFLWAVLIPLLTCVMISLVAWITSIAAGFDFPIGMLWYVVMFRGLFSVHPASVYALPEVREQVSSMPAGSPDNFAHVFDLTQAWHAFATVDMWVGAAIGIAFIIGAIYLRRWRELAD